MDCDSPVDLATIPHAPALLIRFDAPAKARFRERSCHFGQYPAMVACGLRRLDAGMREKGMIAPVFGAFFMN